MRLSLLIFWIFLGLTSCADSLKYSMMKLSGLTSSIERSSDEMISVSQPFKPDLSLNTERVRIDNLGEGILTSRHYLSVALILLTQTSQQIRRENTKQKSRSFLKMVRVKKK